ncbi:MAG: S-layer homology domain-containing protein [Bacillota bacterium]|nr:S-layer homology domain-containing protein [Bacillota bacterium]
MRNLTKVLALVLALTMIVSVAGFAKTYTDVKSDASYSEAVSVLSDLGLVKGYEDGTFGADKTLTRAEGAALVVRLVGLEEAAVAATGSETSFTDVPASHWASGYVAVATQNGIVNGMGDGTFAPDAELTFAQITKMVVVALGYAPLVSELGEWPNNYLSAASQIKLTAGIAGKADDPVSRGTTARILYSSLTIPKMEKSGIGVNATWEAGDTMILDDLGFIKVKGSISSIADDNAKVTVNVTKQCKAVAGKYKEIAPANDDYSLDDAAIAGAKTGAFSDKVRDLQNVPVVVYMANDDDHTITSIFEQSNVDTLSIKSDDVKEISGNKITYYTNAEQTKTDSFKLNSELNYVRNGYDENSNVAVASFVTDFLYKNDAAVKGFAIDFKDTDSDGSYDYAVITDYSYLVVDDITVSSAGKYTFTNNVDNKATQQLAKIVIDPNDDNFNLVSIYKNGEAIGLGDIAKGDVLNVVAAPDSIVDKTFVKGTIYVTSNTVEGTVKYNDTEDKAVTLADGSVYGYADDYQTSGLEAQTEGTFYLNILGDIICVSTEGVQSSYDYGYATYLTLKGKMDNYSGAVIRILDATGKWSTMDLKSTVTVYDQDGTKNASIKIKDGVLTTTGSTTTSAFDTNYTGTVNYAAAVSSSDTTDIVLNSMVAYKTDSTGLVKEIAIGYDGISAAAGDGKTAQLASTKKFIAYEDENSTIGGYDVNDSTVVFSVNATPSVGTDVDEGDVAVTDTGVFTDGQEIGNNVDLYAISSNDLVGYIFGSSLKAKIDWQSSFFTVSKAVDTNLNDDDVAMLTGYQNGELVTYYVNSDSVVKNATLTKGSDAEVGGNAYGYAASAYNKGDVLLVSANADGIIDNAAVLTDIAGYADYTEPQDIARVNLANLKGTDDGQMLVTGFVYGKDGSKVYLGNVGTAAELQNKIFDKADYTTDDMYTVSSTTPVTVYDFTAASKNTISAGDISDISRGSFVFARTDDNNKLQEVVVIITSETQNY